MGKRGFYNGGNLKILKSHFLPEQYINMGQWYTKRCRIVTGGEEYFFFQHEKIMILDSLMKIYTKSTFSAYFGIL